MGYSDTTVNHFMMNKAGVVSYYGPSVMAEFGEYVQMFDYTEKSVKSLFSFSIVIGLEKSLSNNNKFFNDCDNLSVSHNDVKKTETESSLAGNKGKPVSSANKGNKKKEKTIF